MQYTAVIAARAGSRRVLSKNTRSFGDSNLLVNKIRQLKKVDMLDEIIVTSDSTEMLEMAEEENVGTHLREIEYADEKTRSWGEVIAHVAENACHGEHILWAPCVCPFCTEVHFTQALNKYEEVVLAAKEYDSVASVKSFKEYLWVEGKPFNYVPGVPSQNLPDWKILVNGFFIAPRWDMIRWEYNHGVHPYLMELSKIEAIDIDDKEDFAIAECLWKFYNDVT